VGRRHRQRIAGPAPATLPAAVERPPARRGRRAALHEAPPAPWAPFPLVELCILVGLVLMAVGFLSSGPRAGAGLLAGLGLICLATLELSIREHLAGYRSHTLLLALVLAVAAAAPLALLTALAKGVVVAVALTVFAVAAWGLREAFRRRTGGVGFRV